jgi:glycosyltransferase involved in cell wall biosynthesis
MKILMVHDFYSQQGGEDISFKSEVQILKDQGHQVIEFTRNNKEIDEYNFIKKAMIFFNTTWSNSSYRAVEKLIENERPDIVHIQNTFPLISPSVLYACKKHKVPVVVSLRNYRLICANGLFFRDGKVCEDCLGKSIPYPGLVHACYRRSRALTLAVFLMLIYHRYRKTWLKQVDLFIALSEFARNKYIEIGLPEDKIVVKQNFVFDNGETNSIKDCAIFIGRLSSEKGLSTLIDALEITKEIKIQMVGDGPLLMDIKQQVKDNPNIEIVGRIHNNEIRHYFRHARFLVFPSNWYETFGRTIIEAYSYGIPVIASSLGVVKELVVDHQTGLLFIPGDADDLAKKMQWLWDHPEECARMGKCAREIYLEKYTPEKNYQLLLVIYNKVLMD